MTPPHSRAELQAMAQLERIADILEEATKQMKVLNASLDQINDTLEKLHRDFDDSKTNGGNQ